MKTITFTINNQKETKEVDPQMTLLKFIREKLHITGVKEGCGEGECGACTVIIDGKAVNSCLMLAVEADGKHIETVEGLTVRTGRPSTRSGHSDLSLHILQKKFIEHNAVQCGFCSPGMLMSAKALLMKNPNPTEDEIKEAISGNICRCTGYKQIIEAIQAAAAALSLVARC